VSTFDEQELVTLYLFNLLMIINASTYKHTCINYTNTFHTFKQFQWHNQSDCMSVDHSSPAPSQISHWDWRDGRPN